VKQVVQNYRTGEFGVIEVPLRCTPRGELLGVLRVEVGKVPQKGVQGEDQRDQVQFGV